MQSGRGEGRAQDGKRKVFLYYIKIFREEEAEIFFFKQQKKSLLEPESYICQTGQETQQASWSWQ